VNSETKNCEGGGAWRWKGEELNSVIVEEIARERRMATSRTNWKERIRFYEIEDNGRWRRDRRRWSMAERSNCRSDVLVLRALTRRRKMEKRDYSTCKQNLTVYNCLCTIHKHLVYGSYPLPGKATHLAVIAIAIVNWRKQCFLSAWRKLLLITLKNLQIWLILLTFLLLSETLLVNLRLLVCLVLCVFGPTSKPTISRLLFLYYFL
jgi:hypothetical protein